MSEIKETAETFIKATMSTIFLPLLAVRVITPTQYTIYFILYIYMFIQKICLVVACFHINIYSCFSIEETLIEEVQRNICTTHLQQNAQVTLSMSGSSLNAP